MNIRGPSSDKKCVAVSVTIATCFYMVCFIWIKDKSGLIVPLFSPGPSQRDGQNATKQRLHSYILGKHSNGDHDNKHHKNGHDSNEPYRNKDSSNGDYSITHPGNEDRSNEHHNNVAHSNGRTKDLYIYKLPIGRFGNLMFQYASVMGIADHNKRVAVFGKDMQILTRVFPRLKLNIITDSEHPQVTVRDKSTEMLHNNLNLITKPVKSWPTIQEKTVWDFDEKMFHLPKQNVKIYLFLCSFRYFDQISSFLYNSTFSQFDVNLSSKAKKFVERAKSHYNNKDKGINPKSVCVHVRRGDKATKDAHDNHGYRLPTKDDIYNAMDYMEETHKHVVFIVASDTRQWCEQHLQRYNVYISNMTSFYEDFVLMASCDHIIMTVGTFGWWASWLTAQRGGTSMYYNHPFLSGSKKDIAFNRKNSFPPDWIAYDSFSILKSQTKRKKRSSS